jgi:hypothetical protein
MVKNVAMPALISVPMVEPRSVTLKNLSHRSSRPHSGYSSTHFIGVKHRDDIEAVDEDKQHRHSSRMPLSWMLCCSAVLYS